jgi:hypothetical protein
MNKLQNLLPITNQKIVMLQVSTTFKPSDLIYYLYLQQPGKALYALSVALYFGVS